MLLSNRFKNKKLFFKPLKNIDITDESDESFAYLTIDSYPLYAYDDPYKPIGILKRLCTQVVSEDQKIKRISLLLNYVQFIFIIKIIRFHLN